MNLSDLLKVNKELSRTSNLFLLYTVNFEFKVYQFLEDGYLDFPVATLSSEEFYGSEDMESLLTLIKLRALW